VRCGGQLLVGLSAPGASAHMSYVYLQPGPWGRVGNLPVNAAAGQLVKDLGINVIRQGGTVSQSLRWKVRPRVRGGARTRGSDLRVRSGAAQLTTAVASCPPARDLRVQDWRGPPWQRASMGHTWGDSLVASCEWCGVVRGTARQAGRSTRGRRSYLVHRTLLASLSPSVFYRRLAGGPFEMMALADYLNFEMVRVERTGMEDRAKGARLHC
jgi:hypothetical protein